MFKTGRAVGRIAMVICGICTTVDAAAQTPPRSMSTATFICPTADVIDSPMAVQLRELALKPGGRIDPATLMQDPPTAAFIGQMIKQARDRQQVDFAGLCRYRADNAALRGKPPPHVVFLGDSITENWRYGDPALFSASTIDRGIGGQTSAQILLRFYPDVVALQPAVVHIMAGTNDILQNTGPTGDDDIVNTISAMIDIAKAHGIRVVLASIPPISVRSWQPDLKPAVRIAALNDRLRALAIARGVAFADYFAPLKDTAGDFNARLANDGVHPNRDGYAVMKPIAAAAIARAERR